MSHAYSCDSMTHAPGPSQLRLTPPRASGVFSRDVAQSPARRRCALPAPRLEAAPEIWWNRADPRPVGGGAGGVCQVRLPSRVGGAPLDVDSSLRMAEVCVLSHQALHPPRAAAAAHPTKLQEEYPVSNRLVHADWDLQLAELAFDGRHEDLQCIIATKSVSALQRWGFDR